MIDLTPCPTCQHAALHTAQNGCAQCPCEMLADWLGPVALRARHSPTSVAKGS